MIKLENKEDCCGCTACGSVCSHSAISMQPDCLGFLYPVVNEENCVDYARRSVLSIKIIPRD